MTLSVEPRDFLTAGELPLSHIPSSEETVIIKEDSPSPSFKITTKEEN